MKSPCCLSFYVYVYIYMSVSVHLCPSLIFFRLVSLWDQLSVYIYNTPFIFGFLYGPWPIRVAALSKSWTIFARLNSGVVGSNPTQGIDVCVRLYCVCVVLCVGTGLAKGWSPVQGVLQTVYRINKVKKRSRSKGLWYGPCHISSQNFLVVACGTVWLHEVP
jgi:hypothetical protein